MGDYTNKALRTESKPNSEMESRAVSCLRLMHGAFGCGTEAGELQDAVKRFIFYGKEVDRTNAIEELGDLEWYMAIIRDVFSVSQKEVQERNIEKLRKRYPDKFSDVGALNRDLGEERKALDGVE